MYLNTNPRRLGHIAKLLEPTGMRWEFERWVGHSIRLPGGRRNTPLPPDGWALAYMVCYDHLYTPGGFRRDRMRHSMLAVKTFEDLNRAVALQWRHPAISGVAFGDASTEPLIHVPVWRSDDYKVVPFVQPGHTQMIMKARVVGVRGVGQCWHYTPMRPDELTVVPWRDSDPANPTHQVNWAIAALDYAANRET